MATDPATTQDPDPRGSALPRPVIIVGGGEHAHVVLAAARTRPEKWHVIGYSERSREVGKDLGVPYLGDDAATARLVASRAPSDRPLLVLGIGRLLDSRRQIVESFGARASWGTVVHSAAWVADDVWLGEGGVILAGAIVNTRAHIGAHAIINSGAIVEHDVIIGKGTHVSPGAVVGGGAHIGENVLLGMGSIVRDHVAVGNAAVVGMGAVVIADVADGTTVVGVPARTLGSAR